MNSNTQTTRTTRTTGTRKRGFQETQPELEPEPEVESKRRFEQTKVNEIRDTAGELFRKDGLGKSNFRKKQKKPPAIRIDVVY